MQGFRQAVANWWTGETRSAETEQPQHDPSDALQIPSRTTGSRHVGAREAVGLSDVYRAVDIRAIAAKQISFDVERGGQILPDTPQLLTQPDPEESRGAFIEKTVVSMSLAGNAYWRLGRNDRGAVTTAYVMNPHDVVINHTASGRVTGYQYRGRTLAPDEVAHLARLRIPGSPYGLGPIQAAQVELRGAIDVSDYGANFLHDGEVPTGILATDLNLNEENARRAAKQWQDTTGGRYGIVVLGGGLKYQSTFLSPKDAQFIESQQWNTTKVARLFAVPASLMLIGVEGNSQTYQNVEQDWQSFVTFGLANDLTEIEDAFTRLLPRGSRAVANAAALLKTDTKTRYETHNLALSGGWRTVDEIREIEGLPPLAEPKQETDNAA